QVFEEAAMKSTIRTALLSLAVAAFGASAQAKDIETGAIVICDTQQQVERLGQLFDGSPEAALKAVNAEQKDACGAADVVYLTGKPVGTVRNKANTFHVVPVIVVGLNTPNGFQPVSSTVLFSLVKVREFSI